MRKYAFEVVTSSSLSVDAADGRQARDAVEAALQGVTARIGSGSGKGLELGALRLLDPPRLTLIDGVDPFAEVDRTLRAMRGRLGVGSRR